MAQGLNAVDAVVFHTQEYADNFKKFVRRHLAMSPMPLKSHMHLVGTGSEDHCQSVDGNLALALLGGPSKKNDALVIYACLNMSIEDKEQKMTQLKQKLYSVSLQDWFDTFTGLFKDNLTRRVLMKRTRFTDEQIVAMLGENEAGAAAKELCRKYGVSNGPSTSGKKNTAACRSAMYNA